MTTTKFFHNEKLHNLQSPRELVPVLVQLFEPQSVVDFGCGIGTFLYCFKENGVPKVMGMDGKWVDKNLLSKYIDEHEFTSTNLEQADLGHKERYDLAISLEVAEHLSPESADNFVRNMTSLSDNIVFSAAVPGQGGQGHVNEQWPEYWIAKFEKHGYTCHDILRPYLWNNPNIFWWYKQNILVFTKNPAFTHSLKVPKLYNIAHPEMVRDNSQLLSDFPFASKLFAKAVLTKLGLRK